MIPITLRQKRGEQAFIHSGEFYPTFGDNDSNFASDTFFLQRFWSLDVLMVVIKSVSEYFVTKSRVKTKVEMYGERKGFGEFGSEWANH